jgi:hypothetical protein
MDGDAWGGSDVMIRSSAREEYARRQEKGCMEVSIGISINDRPIVGGEISLSHVDKGLYVVYSISICTIHAVFQVVRSECDLQVEMSRNKLMKGVKYNKE